jgi:hypothetical protein
LKLQYVTSDFLVIYVATKAKCTIPDYAWRSQ